MNFPTLSSSILSFFKSHDLDPSLYTIQITTHSPLALDQLRLALSEDFKHLFLKPDTYPRNHFVGHFQCYGIHFLTSSGPRHWESKNRLHLGPRLGTPVGEFKK